MIVKEVLGYPIGTIGSVYIREEEFGEFDEQSGVSGEDNKD